MKIQTVWGWAHFIGFGIEIGWNTMDTGVANNKITAVNFWFKKFFAQSCRFPKRRRGVSKLPLLTVSINM